MELKIKFQDTDLDRIGRVAAEEGISLTRFIHDSAIHMAKEYDQVTKDRLIRPMKRR